MARVGIGQVSIADLNTVYGLGYSLGSYTRSSNAVKNNTIALAPVGTTNVSMNRLRGSYASGTYRNLNITASSTTAGINVTPRNYLVTYLAGLSNNSDAANAYTLRNSTQTGNYGYATTSNVYRQYMFTYTSETQANGMYFRVSNVMYPFAGQFQEQGAWVVAIGFNYYTTSINTIYNNPSIFEFYGTNNANYFGSFAPPSFNAIFDGNNFIASYCSGSTMYWGMLNRAQLRAGVIQPVAQIAMTGSGGIWWDNTIMNIVMRLSFISNAGGNANMDLYLGWDEYLVRGYDLPPENNLYGQGDTCFRFKVSNPGTARSVNGRIFE